MAYFATRTIYTVRLPQSGSAPIASRSISDTGLRRRTARDRERTADELGTLIACRGGMPADAGVRAMTLFEAQPAPSAWRRFANEHPPYDERIELIRAVAARSCPSLTDGTAR